MGLTAADLDEYADYLATLAIEEIDALDIEESFDEFALDTDLDTSELTIEQIRAVQSQLYRIAHRI